MGCLARLVQLAGMVAFCTGLLLLLILVFGPVLILGAGVVVAALWALVIWIQERRPGGFADPNGGIE